jgi:DNA invertase Pin-like site-specific DNA recombinase
LDTKNTLKSSGNHRVMDIFVLSKFEAKTDTLMGHTAYYMRTSHYLQNIATQIDHVEDGWKLYKDEGVSGRVPFTDRPAGKKMMDDIRRGTISDVIVLRLDRLGRDTTDILNTIKGIHQHNVPITSKNEGITTLDDNGNQTPMTGLLINILSGLSEFQYHQTREKTLAGITRGKIDGKYKGRKIGSIETMDKFKSKPKVKKIKEMLEDNIGIRKICRIIECSPNTVYRVKDKLKVG